VSGCMLISTKTSESSFWIAWLHTNFRWAHSIELTAGGSPERRDCVWRLRPL
jgi:hypothetical protein